MRTLILSLTLIAIATLAACASTDQRASNQTSTNTATTKTTNSTINPSTATANNEMPIAPAHGGGTTAAPSGTSAEETGIDTAALDTKITQAEEKAKASGATQADKLAAASAYLERADIFMNAGKPTLYKFALRDYRRTLHYQPDNKQAQDSANMIISIYKSMGRPVPELGNEP